MNYKIGDMIRIYDSCVHLGELCGKVGKIVGDDHIISEDDEDKIVDGYVPSEEDQNQSSDSEIETGINDENVNEDL